MMVQYVTYIVSWEPKQRARHTVAAHTSRTCTVATAHTHTHTHTHTVPCVVELQCEVVPVLLVRWDYWLDGQWTFTRPLSTLKHYSILATPQFTTYMIDMFVSASTHTQQLLQSDRSNFQEKPQSIALEKCQIWAGKKLWVKPTIWKGSLWATECNFSFQNRTFLAQVMTNVHVVTL